jgi:beta-N-acetylhexosaminidase
VILGVLSRSGTDKREPAPTSPRVGKAIRALTPAEKVDSVMLVGFAGTTAPSLPATQGAVVIGPDNWGGLAAGRELLSKLHAAGKAKGAVTPLVVGIQEGGIYRAYPDLPPAEREVDVGDSQTPVVAESGAQQTAAALKQAGFDLNLAPVADIATLDSPIADRAFSDQPNVATAMTAATIRGCRTAKLACAPSHFPGAGAESADTDDGPATVSLSQEALAQRDLEPFEAAFDAGAPAVVVSNAFFAAYDPVTPGSLSAEIVTALLRDELGYKGVAITDDLSSGAIRGGEGAAESAVRALAAGSDLLYISDPADAAAARAALLSAVRAGGVPKERIDDAVGRVLELKRRLGLLV